MTDAPAKPVPARKHLADAIDNEAQHSAIDLDHDDPGLIVTLSRFQPKALAKVHDRDDLAAQGHRPAQSQ